MKRRAWWMGGCAAVLVASSAQAGDPSAWMQPVLRLGVSFGAPAAACDGGAEWMAGFDLQSTFDSQLDRRDAHRWPSSPVMLIRPETPMPLFGLRSRCGDVRQLRAFGFDVIGAENVDGR